MYYCFPRFFFLITTERDCWWSQEGSEEAGTRPERACIWRPQRWHSTLMYVQLKSPSAHPGTHDTLMLRPDSLVITCYWITLCLSKNCLKGFPSLFLSRSDLIRTCRYSRESKLCQVPEKNQGCLVGQIQIIAARKATNPLDLEGEM